MKAFQTLQFTRAIRKIALSALSAAAFLPDLPLLGNIVEVLADKGNLLKIIHVMSDQIVYIGHEHTCHDHIATGISVSAQHKELLIFLILEGSFFSQINDISIVKKLCYLIY